MTDNQKWTLEQSVSLCRAVEAVCPQFGCHVALTGGTLYRDGGRKDCDLIFYRIRHATHIDMVGLWKALESVGIIRMRGFGWCYKCLFNGKSVDCLFPEEPEFSPEVGSGDTVEAPVATQVLFSGGAN